MAEPQGKFKIRVMKPDEVGRVNELVLRLCRHQKMKQVPRLPTVEDFRRELIYEDPATGQMKSNNLGSFVIVACDVTKQDDPNHASIIGYLIYKQAFTILQGRSFWLVSFFIDEAYRRHGLGKKMINFMRLHGLKTGNLIVDVGCMNNNHEGQRFYARFGSKNVNEIYQMMVREFID